MNAKIKALRAKYKGKPSEKMDKYEIASRVTMAGMDGFVGVMDAADQRKLFGANVFGRKKIKINASGQGEVTGSFSVGFGQDFNTFRYSFDEIARVANGEMRATW